MNKDERSSLNIARKFLITNSKQLEQNMNAEFYRRNYCDTNRIFREVHQQESYKNEGIAKNSKILLSMSSPDKSSRIRILLWNYLEDYKNCKMK